MPTCHCLRDRYLSKGTCVSSRCERILVPCFKEKLTNLWNSWQILCVMVWSCIVMYSCEGQLRWRSPQQWWRAFLHCSSSLGLLIHASPWATGPGLQAFCLPQSWSFSSSHSSTPRGEKPGKVAAEICTLIWLQSNEFNIKITVVSFFVLALSFCIIFGLIKELLF